MVLWSAASEPTSARTCWYWTTLGKSLHPPAPEDLYDIIDERYSILVTSDRDPEEWPDWFGDPLLAWINGPISGEN